MVLPSTIRIKPSSQSGISLIELTLVVMLVLALAMVVANLPSWTASITGSKYNSIAREVASKKINYLRKNLYSKNLPNGTTVFSDESLTKIPSSTASYSIEDCSEDICLNDEQVKKVTVQINWKERAENKFLELVTLVGVGGVGQ
ncbi:MAG: hypothetical protein UU73_C0003G0195 [Candidatus Daviesbacteria bacterium GW2011_GWA1_41_61]|uniref:Prepilin-type N-terminal cleavage/methylation domain-containing protein n=1 Tax=Candidatus Daviesbacteria bacterium GW2011_GWA2_40_9 TaxID=1618424 RepID=A0A0G0U992_9BACT|nr:MAG: hypothetical protein UU26_C0003G0031 [Candidatus Daviesbacteria bacterium GW2011_GWC1_40_9]KKR83846.1 MAG: hypothetical protein UU29_C0001G0066 [Candidatus Daviesbacteria bacterium GW2011_GWA2_40_9]KKR93455.1 MAG: hypothetical protein UU44_C0002G0116 [Candidatus Daviesbacteria bacterium GW2011_GWB1_41_15]KKS14996.1 MAG: hypothetical protein UU73_C0003G0195 [Candidatus Daviesbacteria bacterium GW2011_GWA1_41_61]